MLYKTEYKSPVGKLTLASRGRSLNGLWIEGQKYFESTIDSESIIENKLPVFEKTKEWLDRYFAGQKPEISELSLAPEGSEFRQTVWKILCQIPYGKVITYGEIAHQIAHAKGISKMSARAVGGAVGHNPISIIIPCHRVIGHNGKLTGYAGGISIKQRLLELEQLTSQER